MCLSPDMKSYPKKQTSSLKHIEQNEHTYEYDLIFSNHDNNNIYYLENFQWKENDRLKQSKMIEQNNVSEIYNYSKKYNTNK